MWTSPTWVKTLVEKWLTSLEEEGNLPADCLDLNHKSSGGLQPASLPCRFWTCQTSTITWANPLKWTCVRPVGPICLTDMVFHQLRPQPPPTSFASWCQLCGAFLPLCPCQAICVLVPVPHSTNPVDSKIRIYTLFLVHGQLPWLQKTKQQCTSVFQVWSPAWAGLPVPDGDSVPTQHHSHLSLFVLSKYRTFLHIKGPLYSLKFKPIFTFFLLLS